jgi:hypothetical protein
VRQLLAAMPHGPSIPNRGPNEIQRFVHEGTHPTQPPTSSASTGKTEPQIAQQLGPVLPPEIGGVQAKQRVPDSLRHVT